MTDAEIRGRLLKHFHGLRDANDGWVPTSEIILSPDSVSRQAIANACQHLAEAGYIRWEPFNPPIEQHAIGRAKITGTGIDIVTGSRKPTIDVRFPGIEEHDAAILNTSWMDEIERLVESQDIDRVAISKPSKNHVILRDEVSGQSIEIIGAEAKLFSMKEDVGNLRGGFQTQVTSQPARWSLNGPPIILEEIVANTKRWLSERRQSTPIFNGISAEGRRTRFELWEKLGLDRVKADLINGGHRIIGGPPEVRELAWEWVRIKEAEATSTTSQPNGPIALASEEPLSDAALTEIRNAIAEIRNQLPAIIASNVTRAEIVSDVAQIDTELERPTPRPKFLKACLESLRDDLAKAAGAAVATLISTLGLILAKHFGLF